MFLVHLLELPLPLFVQDVTEPAAVTRTSATDPGGLLRDAGDNGVVSEERGERRLGPVGLDTPTLRRPVLAFQMLLYSLIGWYSGKGMSFLCLFFICRTGVPSTSILPDDLGLVQF